MSTSSVASGSNPTGPKLADRPQPPAATAPGAPRPVLPGGLARWVEALPAGVAPAVVLGASVNGLSFARSLGRRRVPVLLLDTTPGPGFHSRFASAWRVSPGASSERDWLRLLEALADALPRPAALFATADEHVLRLSRHADSLSRGFRLLVPSADAVARIVDKRAQYAVAEEAGVPLPRWLAPDDPAALRECAADLVYPCILKPGEAHRGRAILGAKVAVCESAEALEAAFGRCHEAGVPCLVQELVPGPDTDLFGYLGYWDEDGRECAFVTKRKLRQFPPGFGDGSFQETVDEPAVAETSRRLLSAFGYRGLVGVEFKRDARDGSFRLMEINPRTVSGNALCAAAGVDLPWIAYRERIHGERSATPPPFRAGVRYVHEHWDLGACRALRRDGSADLGDWLRAVWAAEARALGAWDDPGPLLATIRGQAAGALRRLLPAPR